MDLTRQTMSGIFQMMQNHNLSLAVEREKRNAQRIVNNADQFSDSQVATAKMILKQHGAV